MDESGFLISGKEIRYDELRNVYTDLSFIEFEYKDVNWQYEKMTTIGVGDILRVQFYCLPKKAGCTDTIKHQLYLGGGLNTKRLYTEMRW